MPWEAWITLGVIGLITIALLRGWAGPDTILLGGMTLLMTFSVFSPYVPATSATPAMPGFPTPQAMVAGFGNYGLITIAVLFVVAAGLSHTGAMSLITEPLLGRPRSLISAQLRMMGPVAGLSAFMNNTPIVAMFMPVVTDWCHKTGLSTSRLFIPLSYAAILGGTCSLVGTSTNIYIYGWLDEPMKNRIGMFSIALVGMPAAVLGIAYLLVAGRLLLPNRRSADNQIGGDVREYTVEMMVAPGSTIDGKSIEQAGLRQLPGAFLVEIERNCERLVAVGPEQILHGNDRLIFAGVVDSVRNLQNIRGLLPASDQVFQISDPRPNRVLVEAVVSDQCPLIGSSIREGRFRTVYNAAIIAVHRAGQRIRMKVGDIVLRPGDTLLIETHPRFIEEQRNSRDFYLASAVADSGLIRHDKAWLSIGILLAMILLMTTKTLSLLNAALLAAGFMVLLGCCKPGEARANINWRVLLAMGAAMGIGQALEQTGAAAAVAGEMLSLTNSLGPHGQLAGIYLIAMLFNMMIGHAGAAALAFPIAHALALEQGQDFMPYVITIMMAASADFANPVSYPTHLMVYGAGGYRFIDFVRIGLPLNLLVMAVTVVLAPLWWPMQI